VRTLQPEQSQRFEIQFRNIITGTAWLRLFGRYGETNLLCYSFYFSRVPPSRFCVFVVHFCAVLIQLRPVCASSSRLLSSRYVSRALTKHLICIPYPPLRQVSACRTNTKGHAQARVSHAVACVSGSLALNADTHVLQSASCYPSAPHPRVNNTLILTRCDETYSLPPCLSTTTNRPGPPRLASPHGSNSLRRHAPAPDRPCRSNLRRMPSHRSSRRSTAPRTTL
jgi:hypothetical protein